MAISPPDTAYDRPSSWTVLAHPAIGNPKPVGEWL
jgi:hypothetical protein